MHIFECKVTVDPLDIETKLMEMYNSNFTTSLPLKAKLRNYALFKFSFEPEPYAVKYLSRNKRSLFAQLRMGILPLRIETGRFQNLELEDRKCIYCNMDKIEDEHHFIFHCTHYSLFRAPFLRKCSEVDKNFEMLDEIEKFRFVLSNDQIQVDTANFVQEAFLFRKSTKL